MSNPNTHPVVRGNLAAALLGLLPVAADAVVFLPEETFALPQPYLRVETQVGASGNGSALQDENNTTGDPTQTFVASAESRVVPGGDTSTEVNAFGVVRSNPFGGISLGWSSTILGTPSIVGDTGTVELPARFSGAEVWATNRFGAAVPQAGVTDVDIDLALSGQLNFRFNQPLQSLAPGEGVGGSIFIVAGANSTRYGEVHLFEIDDDHIFSTGFLGQLAPGVHDLGDFQLTVADILDAGEVVGKSVDYLAVFPAEDVFFAQDGDLLALYLNASFIANYAGTSLDYYALNFDRTFDGLPAADTPGATFSTVPLPGSLWLLGTGIVGAALCHSRRRSRAQ